MLWRWRWRRPLPPPTRSRFPGTSCPPAFPNSPWVRMPTLCACGAVLPPPGEALRWDAHCVSTIHTLAHWLAAQGDSSENLETPSPLEPPVGPWADELIGSGMPQGPPLPAVGPPTMALTPAPVALQPPVQTGQHQLVMEVPCKAIPPHLLEAHARHRAVAKAASMRPQLPEASTLQQISEPHAVKAI